jgi:hypothetical protein
MKKTLFVCTVLILGVLSSLTVGVERAAAQGPAGAGAAAVAQDNSHSLRSLNPVTWVKKDSTNSTDAPGSRSDAERKLTPALQAQGVLAATTTLTDACAPFTALEGCLSALHASHNLGVDFICLRANSTGVHTSADVSGCKVADGEKELANVVVLQRWTRNCFYSTRGVTTAALYGPWMPDVVLSSGAFSYVSFHFIPAASMDG